VHCGDIGQPHRCAVAVGDHQWAVISRHVRLVVGIELVAPVPVVDGAFGLLALAEASAARTSSMPIPYL